jgi:hypothetical protein
MNGQRWKIILTDPVFRVELRPGMRWLGILRPLLWVLIAYVGIANRSRVTAFYSAWVTPLLILVGIGGAVSLYSALWTMFGKEVIEVGTGYLWLSEQFAGRTRHQRNFRAERVNGLRVDDSPAGRKLGGRNWVLGQGRLAFDAGGKTYRFAAGLDRPEAKRLLEELEPRIAAAPDEAIPPLL